MLAQTGKLQRRIPILLYGTSYWREVVDFHALVRHGMIAAKDLELFIRVDDPGAALRVLQERLVVEADGESPSFARSTTKIDPVVGGGP